MSEREIEIFYWRLSLVGILLSPWSIYYLKTHPLTFAFNSSIFVIILFAIIPIQLLIVIIIAKLNGSQIPLKFWVVEPSAHSQHSLTSQSLKSCIDVVLDRLTQLGFQIEIQGESDEFERIQFHKPKDGHVYRFLDHAFSGEISFSQLNSIVKLQARLTLHDTLILDTGESSKLQALCDFLILKSERITEQDFPFTLCNGVSLSLMTTIGIILHSLSFKIDEVWLSGISTAAIGMILLTSIKLLNKPQGSFRYRLVFTGLYLAFIPYLSLIL